MTSQPMIDPAIVLSMIVVTTSWAPVNALSAPGMKPQAAPAMQPARMAVAMASGPGHDATAAPVPADARAPMRNWPSAPMLKRPALNAMPTDSPPRTSGAAWTIVLTRPLTAALGSVVMPAPSSNAR